jgi:hypothetical protein
MISAAGIGPGYRETHRKNLMDKLNVRDIAGLTRESIRLKLVNVRYSQPAKQYD